MVLKRSPISCVLLWGLVHIHPINKIFLSLLFTGMLVIHFSFFHCPLIFHFVELYLSAMLLFSSIQSHVIFWEAPSASLDSPLETQISGCTQDPLDRIFCEAKNQCFNKPLFILTHAHRFVRTSISLASFYNF